ncbi:MAG: hypothetical protein SFV55_05570 [Haliscomenobacter sp.]|uniref:exosortase Y-associated Wzy-like protein n=1 Tax=Haliscomenobacter sp. TaxID=2717303 RepID=UPI0029B89999|nr:hypothetical protein [Haliscomenobacter sp.]MDX2067872.1 hypothetical protein [Haliscomenobacter sp.]
MKYLLIYIPFVFAWGLLDNPSVSYWTSWSSSVLLIIGVLNGYLKPKGYNTSWKDHPLRPIFIPHFIFAGYLAISSIFYFWSLYGYVYFEKINPEANPIFFERAAYAQSLYYLGHAGFLHGSLIFSRYSPPAMKAKVNSITGFCLKLAISFTIINIGLSFFPQLGQLREKAANISSVTAAIALALAVPERKLLGLVLALAFFAVNLIQVLLSGWKESVLVLFILLGAFLMPIYKNKIIILGLPFLLFLLFLLPTYVNEFRVNAWEQGAAKEEAFKSAFNALKQNNNVIKTNWGFLTNRLSEISMFTIYLSNVPSKIPFYRFQIVIQGLEAIVPRVIVPDKMITEELVMKRVRENGIVSYNNIRISAKPPIIVDGYISFGIFGAWIFCFLLGWSSATISVLAENLFGGYILGTGVFFTGLFDIYWRGNCFEFLINTIFWSLMLMLFIFILLYSFGVLKKVENIPTRR